MNFAGITCGSHWIWCTRIKNKRLVRILDGLCWIRVFLSLYFSAFKDYKNHFHSSMDDFKVYCNHDTFIFHYLFIFFISKIWYLLVLFICYFKCGFILCGQLLVYTVYKHEAYMKI